MKSFRPRLTGVLAFCLIWAVILGVPRLRVLATYQFFSDESVARAGLWLTPLARFFPQRTDDHKALAAQYPDDPRVQTWAVEGIGLERAQNLEPLLRRFPNQPRLHAEYLIHLCSNFRSGRVPGTLAAPAPGVAPPPEQTANLSTRQIERALEVCRQGNKLEPQNCFWDMMAALFLFGARRDGEALQAIQNGSQKKYFDDHRHEETRDRIAVQELKRPMLAEGKLTIISSQLFPHLGRYREVSRLATWRAMQDQARGDWKSGLKIRAAMTRLGARMSEQNGTYITTLVGFAVQGVPLRAGAPIPPGWPGNRRQHLTRWAAVFANQCRAHNQNDLSGDVVRDAASSTKRDAQLRSVAVPTLWSGAADRTWMLLGSLNWTGASLLMQLLLTFPAWLLLSVLLFWKRVPGPERSNSASFVVWLAVALVCVGVSWQAVYGSGGGINLLSGAGVSDPLQGALRWMIALGPLLLGALFCGVAGAWRHRLAWRTIDADNRTHFIVMRPAVRRGVWLALALLLLISGVVMFAVLSGTKTPVWNWNNFLNDPVTWILGFLTSPYFTLNLMAFAVAWWIFSSLWLMPGAARPIAGENLKWYRRTLGMALFCGSTLYLALLLISLQVRQPVEMAIEDILQRGEVAVLRSKAGAL